MNPYDGSERVDVQWLGDATAAAPTYPLAPMESLAHGPRGAHRPRRRRSRLVVLLVLVLAAGAASAWLYVNRETSVHITYNGTNVASPSSLLKIADVQFLTYARAQDGTLAPSSRCYFDRVGQPHPHDVSSELFCGPVLFYDSTTSDDYLAYSLTAPKPDPDIVLTVARTPDASRPAALPESARLLRTDHRKPPIGAAGLTVPIPPPGPANVLAALTSAQFPGAAPAGDHAIMGGSGATVTVESTGAITHYGTGPGERSAPPGQKLIGFSLVLSDGEFNATSLDRLSLGVSADNGPVRQLPLSGPSIVPTGQPFVAAVAATARTVDLVFVDGGFTQRISLLTGKPAASNIDVLRRTDRTSESVQSGTAVAAVDAEGELFTAHLSVRNDDDLLRFFTPSGAHPANPHDAYVYVDMCYTSPDFVDSTSCHSFRGTDLTLTPEGGAPIRGKDVSKDNFGYCVFLVPATFTRGTVTVTGSESSGDGWSMTITQPYSFPIVFTS